MRRINGKPYTIILGATGSVGSQAINVLSKSDKIKIVALSCRKNANKINELKRTTGCDRIHIADESPNDLRRFIQEVITVFPAEQTTALNAISGFAGLEASFVLADMGIDTLLANKESVVAGGEIYLKHAKSKGIDVIPVDSEHSSLWTLLKGPWKPKVKKAIITCSGGPFRDRTDLKEITPEEATSNPNWNMGPKISVDSSTLANKLAEVIEAKHLFNLKPEQIEVIIQKNSCVHSLLQLANNSYIAELSVPDMALPIAKAYGLDDAPAVCDMDWTNLRLEFDKPDTERFPFLSLAPELLKSHGKCIAFNAADEEAVRLFLSGAIPFDGIYEIVSKTIRKTADVGKTQRKIKTLDDIKNADKSARALACKIASDLYPSY